MNGASCTNGEVAPSAHSLVSPNPGLAATQRLVGSKPTSNELQYTAWDVAPAPSVQVMVISSGPGPPTAVATGGAGGPTGVAFAGSDGGLCAPF